MNQSSRIDSKFSLDEILGIEDGAHMLTQPYHLYAERKDPAKNMARYYAMDISLDLFGQACLTRHFVHEGDAAKLFLNIARLKRSHGYRPVAATEKKAILHSRGTDECARLAKI